MQSGIGAGHIAVSARDSNKFTVSVNIEPQSKATFYLNYEELLKRINGYEMVINIHPKQPVPQLEVDVCSSQLILFKINIGIINANISRWRLTNRVP